jgi:hypothetical protein
MNDETTTLDQADEDILTYTASDEVIEDAAAWPVGKPSWPHSPYPDLRCRWLNHVKLHAEAAAA